MSLSCVSREPPKNVKHPIRVFCGSHSSRSLFLGHLCSLLLLHVHSPPPRPRRMTDRKEAERRDSEGEGSTCRALSLSLSLSLSVLAIPPSVSQPARTGPLPPSAVPENVLNVTFKGICGDEDRRLLPSSSFPFLCPSPIPIKSDCHCTQNNGSLLLRRFATDSSGFPPAPNGGNIYLSGGNEKARFVLLISLT